jgi:AICAR transformylase/IMP cyclohydrolase PurH
MFWSKDKVTATVSQTEDGIEITYVNDKTFKLTLTTDGVSIDAGEKDISIKGKNIKLAADKVEKKGEYFVILSHMKSILDALTNHNHITSTGPTSPGVLTSSMAPIAAAIMSDLQKLGSDS